ncbi:uncharacterized protein LOC111702939 isoform X2 [Eurytemora carolleeae]|nr:uncharacterized protein LOC111702939 isoform X2 [Eurytemora carolleeae]XP_023330524.1 uncharacterized protein LOC111702939 isoform X2 [Eurytemora carolleeae]|eukprot:XP_023330523.1 uncharacterized protein LOC111702939 isoform X2 [Eurytemora affinis]
MRLLFCFGCLILLKLCETWIFSSGLDIPTNPGYKIPRPIVSHPRCDACRFIGLMIDSNLRSADDRLDGEDDELGEDEVAAIAEDICSTQTYRSVELIEWNGEYRLSLPILETWKQGKPAQSEKDWTDRVSSHCRFLLDKMKGLELYDLWLRAGHRHPASWIEFMCEGEGVFGDCIQDDDGTDWPWEMHRQKISKERSLPLEDNVVRLSSRQEYF